MAGFKRTHGADLVELARTSGQYVINHSRTHADLRTLGYRGVVKELRGGVRANVGRPPYGALDATARRAYADLGMRIWLWSVDTNDWRDKGQQQVVNHVVTHSKRGSTVLLHMQHTAFTPAALEQMRAGLGEKGLDVCRAYRGPDNAGVVLTTPATLPSRLPC